MSKHAQDELNSSIGLNSQESSSSEKNYNDISKDPFINKYHTRPNQNMLPSHSPERILRKNKNLSNVREQHQTSKSFDMRMGAMQITQSQGIFHVQKSSDPIGGFGNLPHVKPEYMSQKSNHRIKKKYNASENNSQTNSYKHIENSGYRKMKTSNLHIKEMHEESPRQDIIAREKYRVEGMRTPRNIKAKGFSRRDSERFIPKRSGSSLLKDKGREKSTTGKKRVSVTKYENAMMIQENKEINIMRGKVNKMMNQMDVLRNAEGKTRKELDLMKRKNLKLREQLREVKKSQESVAKEKNTWFKKYKELKAKYDDLVINYNNLQISNRHIEAMNQDLKTQLSLKNLEIEQMQKLENEKFMMGLRKKNDRDFMDKFDIPNPYDKKGSKTKSIRTPVSPLEQNHSNYTQNTNFVYSEEQSTYSGVHRTGTTVTQYMQTGGKSGPNLNPDSLEGTFVSKKEELIDKTADPFHDLSGLDEYGSENYHKGSINFSKHKDSHAGNPNNMTFGDANQNFKFKVSDKKISEYSERSINQLHFEGSLNKNYGQPRDLLKSSNIHSKNKSETLNMVSEVYPPLLETKSDSKRKRSLNFQNTQNPQENTNSEIKAFNPNLPNSSSTELTRGGLVGIENYASNDLGNTNQSNLLQENNNFTFEIVKSQRLKSQNSLNSRFTHQNPNFVKPDVLKQSNSQTNEFYNRPHKYKMSLGLPFPEDDKNSTLNSNVYESRRNLKDYRKITKNGKEMCRVSAKELKAFVQISENKVMHLKESLNQSRILIKENKILKQKSRLMIIYMNELGRKLKDTSEICRQMSQRFSEQDKLCMEYKNTLMIFMKKLIQFLPREPENKWNSKESDKMEQLISKVNQMLNTQNMHKFQSFLSHQNSGKGQHLMSPPRVKQHIRRTSSMKSLNYNSKPKKSKNLASPYNNKSNLLNSEEGDDSLFVNQMPHLKQKKALEFGKLQRQDLSKSELVKGKRKVKPGKKIIYEGTNTQEGNLIQGFGNGSNLGESQENFAETGKTSVEDLYYEIMTSENISYHQRKKKKKNKAFNIGESKGRSKTNQENRIQHRQVNTLSDLKNTTVMENSSGRKQIFKKKEKSNVFRKESTNTALISNGKTESRLGHSEYEDTSINTKSLVEELSDSSIDNIKYRRFNFRKTRPEFTKTMEDNFKMGDTKSKMRDSNDPKELKEHRQLLKDSQSKFEKKCFKSVSIDNKTRNSRESRDKASYNTRVSSRDNNMVMRRKSKEPPYKPALRKNNINPNVSKNDSINKMKMSFRKSGSFSKRSRLLRTDEEEEDHPEIFRDTGFQANREKLRKEIANHKTPQFKVTRKKDSQKEREMNEYYDEFYQEEEQQRINRANPSEFDSDVKISDSSKGINIIDTRGYHNAKIKEYSQDNDLQSESLGEKLRKVGHNTVDQNYSKKTESEDIGLDRYHTEFETKEGTTQKMRESSVMFTDVKDPQQMDTGNIQRGQRKVKSEFKRIENTAQEPLHCSNVELPELTKKFEKVLMDQAKKKKERGRKFKEISQKLDFNNDIDNLKKMYTEVMEPFKIDLIKDELLEENEEETDQEEHMDQGENGPYRPKIRNFTRKLSNLEVKFLDSESQKGIHQRHENYQEMEETEYEEEEESEEEDQQLLQRRRELLSEKPEHSRKYREYRNEYMNAPSYTHAQKNQGKKYILESNISPEESDVVSRVNLSNKQPLTISKKKFKINRKIEFLSNSKSKKSGLISSQQLRNMASIDQNPSFVNEYNQIDEASMSKEEYSRSKQNNPQMGYREYSDSGNEGHNKDYNIFDLTYYQDLIPHLQSLQKVTMDKLIRYKLFYKSSRKLVQSIQKKMYKIYHIASGEEHVNFEKIKISKNIKHEETQIYFERKENKMNELLQTFVFLVCKTRLETAKKIFVRFQDALQKLFPTFKLFSFEHKEQKLENLKNKQVTDLEEIEDGISQFIDYFFTHLITVSPKKDIYDFDQKTKNFVIKNKLNRSKMSDSGTNIMAVKEKFSHFYKRESHRFHQIVFIEDFEENQTRVISKEELNKLIENFEVFCNKCFKSFFENCEKLSQIISSQSLDSYKNSHDSLETLLMRLYVLEKQAKAKMFRKIHQIILCLNIIITKGLEPKSSNRNSKESKPIEHIPQLQSKSLIKTAHGSIMKVLEDCKFGSVEILLTFIQTNPNNFKKIDNNMFIQMLNECARGDYGNTVDNLFQKPKSASMRYSSSFNIQSSKNSKFGLLGKNFLDYDSMDYGRNIRSSFNFEKDNNGVLVENSEFYDVSFNIIKNFMQMNLLLLSHYIPDLL